MRNSLRCMALVWAGMGLIALAQDAATSGIWLCDYSESGQALRLERIGPGEFNVFVQPGFDRDVLDFAVEGTRPSQPLVFHVHNAPPDLAPKFGSGYGQWRDVPEIEHDGGVFTLRLKPAGERLVVRLRTYRPIDGPRPYYDVARLEAFLATLAGDPFVTVEIIGWSYQNRPHVDLPIYKVTVSDPSVPDDDKLPVLVTARVHGNEDTNSYITEGLVEYARGSLNLPPPHQRPDDLLERMMFVVYIMLNPDGVEGDTRYNKNGIDLNRNWDETGSGPSEQWEVRHVHSDIEAFMSGHFFAHAVDMHGWWFGYEGGYRFGLGVPPGSVPLNYYDNQQTFFERQEEYNPWRPAANFDENGATDGMARYCLYKQFNIDVHTSETDDPSDRSVQSVLDEGGNYVLSFYHYLLNTHFTDQIGHDVKAYVFDVDPVHVTVIDYDENHNSSQIEQVSVTITNSANEDVEIVSLVETGPGTGVFRNASGIPIALGPYQPGQSGDGTIQTEIGATLTAAYTDNDFTQSTSRVTALVASVPGDLNCDGLVDFGDINPFVLALTNPAGYAAAFPNCDIAYADIDGDGKVDFGDINPFVRLLTGG